MPRAIIAFASLALVAGCFSPTYPEDPFLCSKDTKICPADYTCNTEAATGDPTLGICEKPGGGTNPGKCLDSDLEPNDTPGTATSLDSSLQSHPTGVSLFGVEICTAEDVDYYSFTMAGQKPVTITIQYQRDQGELSAALLDANMNDVAPAAPTAAGLQITTTLQAGMYYLKVTAGAGGSTNLYDFSLSIGN
ncbi:MAG TPA: hypothetical protein VGQ83_09580 [Polyangia bacterium]|jgi:hypothetical protein